jgi:hypothetical protein
MYVCMYVLWSFGTFCGHLVYFVAIWYILWPFGIFCGHLVYFSSFGICQQVKSGNPALNLLKVIERVTRCVCERIAQNYCIILTIEKVAHKIWATFETFN